MYLKSLSDNKNQNFAGYGKLSVELGKGLVEPPHLRNARRFCGIKIPADSFLPSKITVGAGKESIPSNLWLYAKEFILNGGKVGKIGASQRIVASGDANVEGKVLGKSLDIREKASVANIHISENTKVSGQASVNGGITKKLEQEGGSVKNLHVVNQATIGGGNFDTGKARGGLICYGDAVVKNVSSSDGTFVGGNAVLTGGRHTIVNAQNNSVSKNVKASRVQAFHHAKVSDSVVKNDIEANDFTVLKNVKADTIKMNSWFASLQGKDTQCKKLEADVVWRALHMDFRRKITPQPNPVKRFFSRFDFISK